MKKELTPITHTSVLVFEEQHVRIISMNGKPYFVAKDVCQVLEISKYRDAIKKLDSDERASAKVDTLGGKQTMATITESGFYKLIFQSPKANQQGSQAHRFTNWICREVIPSIRKTGGYGIPFGELNDFSHRETDSIQRGSISGKGLNVRRIEKHALEQEKIRLLIKYQPALF